MLKDEREIVLNDVLLACRKAADHYEQAAELVDDSRSRELFAELYEKHLNTTRSLKQRIEELGYLPEEPNADRQTLAYLTTHVQAAIQEDQRGVLVQKALKLEKGLEASLEKAHSIDWSPDIDRLLERLTDDVRTTNAKLQAL